MTQQPFNFRLLLRSLCQLATVYYCQGTPLIMSKCLIQQQQKSRAHYTLKIIKGFEILSVILKAELVIYFKFSIESAPFIVVTKFVITLQNSKLDFYKQTNSYHHPFLAILTSFQPTPSLPLSIWDVHQFIGHCLIPLDPYTYTHKLSKQTKLLQNS